MVRKISKRPAPLSEWMEQTMRLPAGIAAVPGELKLHAYQRQIADSLVDPKVERITVLKSARVGFTTTIIGCIAHHIIRDPSPVLCILPREADARGFVVDDLEQTFEASPALRDRLPMPHPGRSDRNTLLHRLFDGGSLKVVPGVSPRNMRRHSAKILIFDELDAIEQSAEGDIFSLGVQRTLSWPGRRIIAGGTPLNVGTSTISRLYAESDQRIYECPCPNCGAFAEIEWSQIEWPGGEPAAAAWRCPSCHELVPEKHKPGMVRRGAWRPLRPEVAGHAGFRISSLVSLLPACCWGELARKYEAAKGNPALVRVFWNTDLGLPYEEEGETVDGSTLAARAEAFGLDVIPGECLALTAGIDMQDDRAETVILGHGKDGTAFVLAHEVIFGDIADELLWQQIDQLLRTTWQHPKGGRLRIEAAAIDGGDGGHMQHVLAFCRTRAARRIMCIKGAAGFARLPLVASKSKMRGGGRLWVVGSDSVKAQLFVRLGRGNSIRFSDTLAEVFYEQLSSERRVVRTVGGRPVARFERIKGARAEALDALVYAIAAKGALTLRAADFDRRDDELRVSALPAEARPPPKVPSVIRSRWMDRGRGL
jgi:phage terminase large subunit GpA-like protein